MVSEVKVVTETDVARRSAVRKFNYDVVVLAGCFSVDPNVLANIRKKTFGTIRLFYLNRELNRFTVRFGPI